MKKDGLFLSLTCVVLGVYASCLTPSLPLSVTSKGIILTLSSFVFSSAALMGLVLALRDTWSITQPPAYSNRLATLAKKEREILAGSHTKTMNIDHVSFDEWRELNDQDRRNNLRSSHCKEKQHDQAVR